MGVSNNLYPQKTNHADMTTTNNRRIQQALRSSKINRSNNRRTQRIIQRFPTNRKKTLMKKPLLFYIGKPLFRICACCVVLVARRD